MRPEILLLLVINIVPIIVGFAWIRPDAERSGQPGVLWAILTIPFGWLAVLVYVVVRSLRSPSPQSEPH